MINIIPKFSKDEPQYVVFNIVNHNVNYSCTHIIAVPGSALEAHAIAHRQPGAPREDCVIFAHWHKPNNIATIYIKHYNIYSDESRSQITSAGATAHSKVIHLSGCDLQSITITAVDKCGREGLPAVTPIQWVFVNDNVTTTIIRSMSILMY